MIPIKIKDYHSPTIKKLCCFMAGLFAVYQQQCVGLAAYILNSERLRAQQFLPPTLRHSKGTISRKTVQSLRKHQLQGS